MLMRYLPAYVDSDTNMLGPSKTYVDSDTNCDNPYPQVGHESSKIGYKYERLKVKPINPLRTYHTSRYNDTENNNTIHHPATRHGSEVQTEIKSTRMDPDA